MFSFSHPNWHKQFDRTAELNGNSVQVFTLVIAAAKRKDMDRYTLLLQYDPLTNAHVKERIHKDISLQ